MLRSIKCTRYVKGVLLLTPNTVQGGGGSTWSTFSSPKTQSVPNVLTRIVACEQALRLALKVDVREARERRRRTRRCRGGGGGGGVGAAPRSRVLAGLAQIRELARRLVATSSDTCCCLNWGCGFSRGRGVPLRREESSHSWRARKILRVWQLPRPHELEYFKTQHCFHTNLPSVHTEQTNSLIATPLSRVVYFGSDGFCEIA